MLLTDYLAYFEKLAAAHPHIQHVPGSLHADADPGTCRFATYNATDVLLKRTRTKVGYPALLAEVYEWQLGGKNIYDAKGYYQGAISIVARAQSNDAADEVEQLKLCEKIMAEVVQRMYADHNNPEVNKCQTPFGYIDIANGEAMAFGPIWENVFGWRFEFSFRPKTPLTLNKPLPTGYWLDENE